MAKAARLTWTLPTTRTDGSPLALSDIGLVDIFDGTDHLFQGGAMTTFTTGVLTVGQHNFTVTVTDTEGHVSLASNVATVTVISVLASPSAVADLSAVLVDI